MPGGRRWSAPRRAAAGRRRIRRGRRRSSSCCSTSRSDQIAGMVSGLLAGLIFNRIWTLINRKGTPKPTDERRGWGKSCWPRRCTARSSRWSRPPSTAAPPRGRAGSPGCGPAMKASSPTSRTDYHQATAAIPHGQVTAASQANARARPRARSDRSRISAVPPLLLPSRWTTPVPCGQLWKSGPAHGPQRTVLDDTFTPTDQMAMPAACPARWSTEGYHGHSRTTAQAPRPGLTHVSQVAEET